MDDKNGNYEDERGDYGDAMAKETRMMMKRRKRLRMKR